MFVFACAQVLIFIVGIENMKLKKCQFHFGYLKLKFLKKSALQQTL